MRRVVVAVSICLLASAGDGRAQTQTLRRSDGAQNVLIYKDKASLDEADTLVRAGVHRTNRALVDRLLACAVPNGTKAVRLEGGSYGTRAVMVVEGPAAGCRGVIYREDLE